MCKSPRWNLSTKKHWFYAFYQPRLADLTPHWHQTCAEKALQESRELFGENELAYLSLTSKNESVIRDRIAYKLHLELKNSIVAREHSIKAINSRIDLAVLENNDIKDIIWN